MRYVEVKMSLKVTIFEDDIDVAELLKEMMESHDFVVDIVYNLSENSWHDSDVILGDYRNKIVNFEKLRIECEKKSIPLIAISGAETDFRPQLLKPFLMEDLQASILQSLMSNKKKTLKKDEGFLSSLFKKTA